MFWKILVLIYLFLLHLQLAVLAFAKKESEKLIEKQEKIIYMQASIIENYDNKLLK